MKHLLTSLIVAAGFMAAQASAQKLTFDEAVRRALDRSSEQERARLAVALANERYLETQSKFRWDFRPRIGLLAFSNPALLASSVGLGMALGRTQPPAWVRQSARLDVLAAEVAIERAVTTARLTATRQFYEVLLRRQTRDDLSDAVRYHQSSRRSLEERSRSARVTALDEAVWETRLLAMEGELEDANTSLGEATALLAHTIGADSSTDLLQVADSDIKDPASDVATASILRNVVFQPRKTGGRLHAKLEAEAKRIRGASRVQANPLSINYAHLGNQGGSALQVGQNGYLLGGHTGSIDLGVRVSLRRTGEEEALAQLAMTRIRSIELELKTIDDTLHHEVNALRQQVLSSTRRADLAARRLKLSTEVSRLVSVREQSGLESAEALLHAEAELIRNRAAFQRAQAETKARWKHLLAACELADTEAAKTLLVGQTKPLSPDSMSAGVTQ